MNKSISLLKIDHRKIDHKNESSVLDEVKARILAGADVNERTKYFETPLRVFSRLGHFRVVKLLFESGADPSHLNWTPLFHAVANGSLQQVKDCIGDGAKLNVRDTWERTPFLVAVQGGELNKVEYLLQSGADITNKGRGDKSALEYAIQMDNARILSFLIEQGVDFEKYNPFGYTPLIQAVEEGAINCVRRLLELGANIHRADRSQFSKEIPINHASTLEMAEILLDGGADLEQINSSVRSELLSTGTQDKLTVSKKEYQIQKNRVFGTSNPQKCELSFWYDMVRCGAGAYKARDQYDDRDNSKNKPVWCYDRYGKSITSIGNGEYIEIAGEHEDSYDPDFCIYNEVFHHKGDGDFTIYQYPKEIFPPTDFHTATFVNGYVYIIGNLGYPKDRDYRSTPVFRLDTQSFKIEKLETSGESPGWIYNHSAYLKGDSSIVIQGGEILTKGEEREGHQFNKFDFRLDVNSLAWSKHPHTPKSGILPFFPKKYKVFSHSDSTLLANEESGKWRLIRLIAVHRIDVSKGDEIQFEHETVTATADDYLFVVAYSTSETFDSFEQLEEAVENKLWDFEDTCQVCRTTAFPKHSRYIGFSDITEDEKNAFREWRNLYEDRQVKIL